MVEFELEKKGTLQLDIWIEGAEIPNTLTFDAKANTKRLEMGHLPEGIGEWQAAELTVGAYDKSGEKIEFRLFGIGVGDRAVGSTGIYQVTFEPSVIRNTELATWGFRSKHDFERAESWSIAGIAVAIGKRIDLSSLRANRSAVGDVKVTGTVTMARACDQKARTWWRSKRGKASMKGTGFMRYRKRRWRSNEQSVEHALDRQRFSMKFCHSSSVSGRSNRWRRFAISMTLSKDLQTSQECNSI